MAAPAQVQKQNNTSVGGAASFASLPTIGNLIVVFQFAFSTMAPPTDNQGGSNVYDEQIELPDLNGNVVTISTAKVVASAGTFTVTPAATAAMYMEEVSGWHGTSVFDGLVRAAAKPSVTAPWDLATAALECLAPEDRILIGCIDQNVSTFTAAVNGAAASQEYTSALRDSSYVWSSATSAAGIYTPSVRDTGAVVNTCVMAAIAIRGQGALLENPFGGGAADDRYRFRDSQLWSGTSTLGTKRSAWPNDARDGGLRDAVADSVSRMT